MTQGKALSILKSGKNVFLTGSAGAGKTYVLNQYINYLRERKVGVAVTASTGIAATHMNGQTIHAWSGIGVRESLSSSYLTSLMSRKYFKDKMDHVKVLIIDEISMLHRNQLELVNHILKVFKTSQAAFGGIQVIFSGDFFQLPPIGNQGESNKQKFAFMSQAWLEVDLNVCYLTEQHRQEDQSLNGILNEIRIGEISQSSMDALQESFYNDQQTSDVTQLFTHNADVDSINQLRLKQIDGQPKKFKAKGKGNEFLVENLKKSVLTDELLELKIGAQVMFIKNNYEKNYFNGTMGEVVDYSEKGFPVVKTKNKRRITVETETWAIEDENGKSLASYTQIPLRLAWAITVHKSQGMTLDTAQINLGKTFEPGQGYVALSRLKSISGLQLVGINQMALQIDALARKADVRFQELSNKLDMKTSIDELEPLFDPFIEYCGGEIRLKEIKKNREKLQIKKQKKTKVSTYQITKEWIEKGLGIEEIAQQRGLTTNTIIKHGTKLYADFPNMDIRNLRPEEHVMTKLQSVVLSLNKEDKLSKKQIFELLKGELSYEIIELGLLFINSK